VIVQGQSNKTLQLKLRILIKMLHEGVILLAAAQAWENILLLVIAS
jgi:hypothetical protein